MEFDPHNIVVKLCIQGMDMEGKGNTKGANRFFLRAWNKATNDFERVIAAHYLARHQKSVAEKLKWDETALQLALKINDDTIRGAYPSLYLNIAKCYEDLNEPDNARKNYQFALLFTDQLPDNAYGNMIKQGITSGLERVKNTHTD